MSKNWITPFFEWWMILAFLVLNPAASVLGQDIPRIWGDLQSGPHEVGFKTLFEFDVSRPAIPYSGWHGRLVPTRETRGRQMQINVWYPADVRKGDKQVLFSHYLALMAQQTEFGSLDDKMRKFADEQFISKTNDLGGNGSFTIEKLKVLKDLKTNSYFNAEPVNEKFPLIVFPNGGSPAFQSTMCEFFASHGFIVVAFALKGQHAFTEEISVRGIEVAVSDLSFAIGKVLEIPQVDKEKICLIGNAITASQSIAYQARNQSVDCVVSLDGGFLSQFDHSLLRRTAFYSPQDMNKPILAIYAPHPSIDPENISHLKFSDRFFFHFPQMSEFHFLNFGVFERFVPGIIGQTKGDVQKGFEVAALYCLRFFEAYLKEDRKSLQFLRAKPPDTSVIDKHSFKEGLPSPPTTTELKDSFIRTGFGSVEKVYAKLKERNPTPFSKEFYNDFRDWLAWKKDPDFENRFKLYRLGTDSFPESATLNYYFAYYALKTGRKDVALEYNRKTLNLIDTDDSSELTPARKAEMKENILKDLKTLDVEP
ncbi:MAG: hypothetical protein DWQ47_03815 [Acidobacteria bacterium]|nr:MAG: hypothetical protein DWQ32_07365 [Acidobacteriota bacterium]REK01522.1 MAG: hypothetical protein DWQ38_03800 [Acidobacteriota bacterium]REK14478.1 MAG: hypothetical protein DWQ43_13055 [Acidobacteriota bacterium]REK45193.1 MAG: hypothetical protein DWQ47_03815 [Acidobacteriota bacterium]